MDPAFDENQTELRVLILSELFQMLAHGHSLLHQGIEIFWDFWGDPVFLEHTENLASRYVLNLWNAGCVTE